MGEVTLKIENVECTYGTTRILKNISFEIKPGDFVGLIGPNGSGKTTLLKSISRVLKPRVGIVLLDGKDVYTLKAKEVAKKVGVVPQETPIPFQFTALEIVLMGRTPHLGWLESEKERDYEIARTAMKIANCLHLSDRIFAELSGGEKQRVLIARALAQEPKVLLLDEPTAHLDINYQEEILNLLKRLSGEKLTILAVFHDLNLAARYCDSLILLNQGEIEAIGTPEEVLTPENIKRVYRIEVLVKRHPITNSLYLIPFLTSNPQTDACDDFTVHLVCGGGTGTPLMHSLLKQGYRVTVGAVSTLDTDYEATTYLNVPVVTLPPFSPASDDAHRIHLELVGRADAVVLTDVPIGWGNLKNLEAVEVALRKGIPVIMVGETPFEKRDFTGGEALERLIRLKDEGAICVKSLNEVLTVIETLRRSCRACRGKSTQKPLSEARGRPLEAFE